MSLEGSSYKPKETAELLGKYGRLKKKLAGLPTDELQGSDDYENLLRMQRNLGSMSLTGEQILELAEFYDKTVIAEDIMKFPIYGVLEGKYRELEEKHQELEEKHSGLKSMLREVLKPFSGPFSKLLELLEE